MTVLIALEFNHTLQYVVSREQSIIQTKIVLLIGLLVLSRKFIILDLKEATPNELLGLAAVTLALGICYWLLRERDDRLRLQTKAQSETAPASKPQGRLALPSINPDQLRARFIFTPSIC